MSKKDIICVICPSSCHVTVDADGKVINKVSGASCKLGDNYARTEYLNPERTLTSTIKANGYKCPIISIRSNAPIAKELITDCMVELRKIEIDAPFSMGRVVIENILNTGVDIVLTNE